MLRAASSAPSAFIAELKRSAKIMTVLSMLSYIRKAALVCAIGACIAALLCFVFALQARHAKDEYDTSSAKVRLQLTNLAKESVPADSPNFALQSLPVLDLSNSAEDSRLFIVWNHRTYQKSLAGSVSFCLAILSILLFAYQHAIHSRIKKANQSA